MLVCLWAHDAAERRGQAQVYTGSAEAGSFARGRRQHSSGPLGTGARRRQTASSHFHGSMYMDDDATLSQPHGHINLLTREHRNFCFS